MEEKYQILLRIIEELRKEAPENYQKYQIEEEGNESKLITIKSRCYIHLFLKVAFGMLNFIERENYITDGSYDGGIDAYYIDEENKQIYYI